MALTLSDAAKRLEEEAPSKRDKKKKAKTPSAVPTPEPERVERKDVTDSAAASDDDSKTPELSKREKRRAKEAKKKAEEEAAELAAKEARKEAKKAAKAGPPPPEPRGEAKKADDKFVMPKQKGKKGKQPKVEKVVITDQQVHSAVNDIQALRTKMVDKWGQDWTGKLNRTAAKLTPDLVSRLCTMFGSQPSVADVDVLCLGLGKPYNDRTAKIQLALIMELTAGLGAPVSIIKAYDPVFDDGDRRVLAELGCSVIEDNLVSYDSESQLTPARQAHLER